MATEPIERDRRAPAPDRRWAALDGLRGVAIVAFVAGHLHVPGLAGGWIGLEVLFVLSGFSVTCSLLDGVAAGPGRAHLLRVASRVVPVVVAAVAFALVWSYVQDGEFTGPVREAALASLGQVYGIARVYGSVDGRAFTTMWAVGLVAVFSVLAVFVVPVVRRRAARAAAATLMAAAFVVATVRVVVIGIGGAPAEVMVLPWFRLDGLLLGAAVAFGHRRLAVDQRQQLYRTTVPALAALAVAVVIVPAWFSWPVPSVVAVIPLVSILGAVVLLALVTRSAPAVVTKLLATRALRAVGRRSLGLYIWHYPIAVMLVGGGTEGWQGFGMLGRQLALTAVVVLASYEFVERPLRR